MSDLRSMACMGLINKFSIEPTAINNLVDLTISIMGHLTKKGKPRMRLDADNFEERRTYKDFELTRRC